jgi:hypothetical protein
MSDPRSPAKDRKYRLLKPGRQQISRKKIHSLDIETYDRNRRLLMTSVSYQSEDDICFLRQHGCIKHLKHDWRSADSIYSATNLGFDFFGLFYNTDDLEEFLTLFRGSGLIYAKSSITEEGFKYRAYDDNRNERGSLKFLDTMNYSPIGVKKIGEEILKIPKLDVKEIVGRMPVDDIETSAMITYNIRDCEISKKFMVFIKDSIEKLGGTFKDTIASSALSIFRNVYLKKVYFVHPVPVLKEVFKSYYGGRCEVFKRGTIEKMYYFDLNALYPSCMLNKFPDPNTLRTSYVNSVEKIMQHEGCSDVDIFCPNMKHPLLPYRMPSKKVVFPCGSFNGWYTHIELRKAIELGYRIIKVRKSHWYKDTCEPFKEFVVDMYNKRMMWQSEKNPMEITAKLVMNSLYGKMGQTFVGRQNYIPYDLAVEDDRLKILDRIGDYARVEQIDEDPANYCFPIWASYVTSYGRLKLYDYITRLDPAYCDTDSIMTKCQIDTSKELGEMKLEMVINEGVLVKPKFYALHGFKMKDGKLQEVEEVKIKGFSRAISFLEIAGEKIDLQDKRRMKKFLTYLEFKGFLSDARARYNKFLKLKEAIRRDMLPNEDVIVRKEFTLEDDKRMWKGKFRMIGLEESRSIIINALQGD